MIFLEFLYIWDTSVYCTKVCYLLWDKENILLPLHAWNNFPFIIKRKWKILLSVVRRNCFSTFSSVCFYFIFFFFLQNCFTEVYLTYSKLHIFKRYNLFLTWAYKCEIIIAIKVMSICTICKVPLWPYFLCSFLIPPVYLSASSLHPLLSSRRCAFSYNRLCCIFFGVLCE